LIRLTSLLIRPIYRICCLSFGQGQVCFSQSLKLHVPKEDLFFRTLEGMLLYIQLGSLRKCVDISAAISIGLCRVRVMSEEGLNIQLGVLLTRDGQ
jgi:hypothetical protein